MARKVMQFRYYGPGNLNNCPSRLSKLQLTRGTAFNSYRPIKQLGIQAPPGTQFTLNNSLQPIIVGHTGIYELELDDMVEIFQLSFSGKSIDYIDTSSGAYLIIDMIYGEKEEQA